ncbi:MAG: hypothetical protein K2O70_03425 [Desulfovibrionaceae bacterium]|nr:hypothetical protein [Desulfovibrionaceae bacterium]
MANNAPIPANYNVILEDLKNRVHSARMRAVLAANSELVGLYLEIGRKFLEQQRRDG